MTKKITRREFLKNSFDFSLALFLSNFSSIELENPSIKKYTLIFENKNKTVKQAIKKAIFKDIPLINEKHLDDLVLQTKKQKGYNFKKPGKAKVFLNIPENYAVEKMKLNAVLNIPAFKWRWYQNFNDKEILLADSNVVVGSPGLNGWGAATPIGDYFIYKLHHWPSWTNPKTGRTVRAGKHNPLGEWKVMFDTKRRIYFHGTNNEKSLNKRFRMLSHGCIRNYNDFIANIAYLLLKNDGNEKRDKIFSSRRSQFIYLKTKIPLKNKYDLIELMYDKLFFYPNIYNKKKEDNNVRLVNMDHAIEELSTVVEAWIDKDKLKRVIEENKNINYAKSYEISYFYKKIIPKKIIEL